MRQDIANTTAGPDPDDLASESGGARLGPIGAPRSTVQTVHPLRKDPCASQDALLSLMEASRAAAESDSLEEALRMLVWHAAETLEVPECIVYEYDPPSETIVPLAIYERVPSGWEGLGERLPLSECPAEKAVLESGRPLLERISDPDLTPESLESMRKWGEKTCFSIPLLVGSQRMGLMAFYDAEREREFDEAQMALARGLAALAGQAIHSAQLVRQTEERNVRLTSLLQANRAINSSLDLDEVLEAVANQAITALDCDGCTMYQREEWDDGPLAAGAGETGNLQGEQALQQRSQDPDLGSAVRAEMEESGERSRLVIPLPFGRSRLGTMVISQCTRDRLFSDADVEFARGLAEQAGLAIHNARQYQELRRVHVAGLRALVSALGAKEWYTQGHGARVAQYLSLLGTKLGWSEDMVQRAEEAGYLHDIGKLIVSDAILHKTGPLSEREWMIMRTHPETSADILQSMMQEEQTDAIRHHHERYDGGGYPYGLKGEDTPLMARAMCVVDAYDAMSCLRPYRQALRYADCRAELKNGRGSHFDPEMVDAFLDVLDDMDRRRRVCLSVAEKAAALVDGDKHELLKTREDENRPEYREIAGVLRDVLRTSEGIRFLTTQRKVGSRVVFVVDPEETEQRKSHIGDELFAVDDEMREVLAGLQADRNALYADEFGVWITASAPLRDGEGNIVGLVAADSPARPSPVHDGEDAAPASMASLLGEVTKRIVRAEFEATIDGLTGIYNHRYLHEHLTGEVSKAIERRSEFAVLFVDIDYFKAFNDRWGHSLGDEVLRAVAHIIEGQIRRGDIVARYGGEEFVAVLSDCDLGSGMQVAERIRANVARSPLVVGTDPVTVSIGVALFPAHAASRAELIERADTAMYEAKRLGRNRVQACL